MQRSDVGMAERRQHLDLAEKPGGEFRRFDQVGEQHFHRVDAIGQDVPHPEHLPHASAADLGEHFVVADALAWFHAMTPTQAEAGINLKIRPAVADTKDFDPIRPIR